MTLLLYIKTSYFMRFLFEVKKIDTQQWFSLILKIYRSPFGQQFDVFEFPHQIFKKSITLIHQFSCLSRDGVSRNPLKKSTAKSIWIMCVEGEFILAGRLISDIFMFRMTVFLETPWNYELGFEDTPSDWFLEWPNWFGSEWRYF